MPRKAFRQHCSGRGNCSERCTGVFYRVVCCFQPAYILLSSFGERGLLGALHRVFFPRRLLFSVCFYSACIVRGKGTARSAAPVFFCRIVCCSRPAYILPASFGEKGILRENVPEVPQCLSFGDAVLRGIGNYGRAGNVPFRFWTGGCRIIPAYPEAVASVPYFCTVIFFLSVPAEKSGAGKDDSRFRSQGSRCDRCKVGRIPEAGAADVLKSKRGTNRGD